MKIVMLCDFYAESLEYQENLLVRYYRKHGHEVVVIASTFDSVFDYYNDLHDKNKPRRTYEDQGATIIKLPYRFNIINRLRAYVKIDDILEREAPDLIYVHDIMLNFPECVRYVKRNPACKMIMDYHADYTNSGKNAISRTILHGVVRKWVLDRARPYLSGIFPIVPGGAVFLHEIYKVPYDLMEILPLGADVDLASKVKASNARRRLRTAYGLRESDFVIFTGGKLDHLKCTEALIDAVLPLDATNVHLFVVGDASDSHLEYRAMLHARAAGASNIRFTGWLSPTHVYEHLDMSDIAVFPASQSILWQQAICMGLPLLIGDRIKVANGKQDVSYLNLESNMLILDDTKPMVQELSIHIRRLISDLELRSRMAAGAALVTARVLDWNVLIERTLRFNRHGGSQLKAERSAP